MENAAFLPVLPLLGLGGVPRRGDRGELSGDRGEVSARSGMTECLGVAKELAVRRRKEKPHSISVAKRAQSIMQNKGLRAHTADAGQAGTLTRACAYSHTRSSASRPRVWAPCPLRRGQASSAFGGTDLTPAGCPLGARRQPHPVTGVRVGAVGRLSRFLKCLLLGLGLSLANSPPHPGFPF